MITKEEATEIAANYVKGLSTRYEIALLHNETKEFDLGWVFFYQSQKFIVSGDYKDMIAGNAPLIVNKYDGNISITGTAYPIEKYIDDYLKTKKN